MMRYWLKKYALLAIPLLFSMTSNFSRATAAKSEAIDYAELAVKLCNSLKYSEAPPEYISALVDAPSIRAVGVIFDKVSKGGNDEKLPKSISSGIQISERLLITTMHSFKYAHDIAGKLVLFGCTNEEEDAGQLKEQFRLYELQIENAISSPKEHLDYAALSMRLLYSTEASKWKSELKTCAPAVGENLMIAGYEGENNKDGSKMRRLAVLNEPHRKILRSTRFSKTGGSLQFIDYSAEGLHDGFSGAAVFTKKGCLLGMHHRRFKKIPDEFLTKWDPYVSTYYPHCRKKPDGSDEEQWWNDICLPAQANWIGDVFRDMSRKNNVTLRLGEIPPAAASGR